MTEPGTPKDILKRAKDAAQSKKGVIGWVNALSILMSPIAYPLLFFAWNDSGGDYTKLAVFGGFFIAVVIQGTLAYLAQTLSTADHFYFEYRVLEKKYQKEKQDRKEALKNYAREQAAMLVIKLMLVAVAKFARETRPENPISARSVKEKTERLMKPIVDLRDEAIGFGEARHNIAVYLYNNSDDVLRMFYRDVHDDIPRKDRDITPPEGHVGYFFNAKKKVFSGDVTEAASHLMFDNEREDTPYQSIAVAPIFDLDKQSGTPKARGVFIVSSDRKNQITEEKHEGLVTAIAEILSLFLSEVDLHLKPGETYV